jgi:hypothetical protein
MKRVFVLYCIAVFAHMLFCVPFNEILNDSSLYAGLGRAQTYERANQKALDDLSSKISTTVESSYSNVLTEENGELNKQTELILRTYSNTMLRNTQCKVDEESQPGMVYVVRYVQKEDMQSIFADRKRKILDYATTAMQAEEELRIGDALRYYYWALVLLRSHPDNNSLTLPVEQREQTLITLLPNRIERIFSLLTFTVECNALRDAQRTIKLAISYKQAQVQNLDIMYYTGDSWSCPISANNGCALLDFYDEFATNLTQFDLKIEYMYYNKRNIDAEIRQLLEDFDTPLFAASRTSVVLSEPTILTPPKQATGIQVEVEPTFEAVTVAPYQQAVQQLIGSLQDASSTPSRALFTPQGYEQYQKIVAYGNARLMSDDVKLFAARVNDEVTVRPIPLQFEFPNNNQKFSENLAVIFNADNKIDAVNLTLSKQAIDDILNKSEAWGTLENKYQIIQFMEYYKTAYCLKNIDFVQNVFAENALIIVGNVLQQDKPIENMYQKLDNVEYIRLSKQEYVQRLQHVFRSNEYVNVSFADNTVKKVNGDDKIYGIQIAQDYWSSNYADTGYLFLMIDLNNAKEPKIYVRSWQPQKNPDGSIIGLKDFQLY